MGFQLSKVQKPAPTARFNGSLAYVFAARRTVGQMPPLLLHRVVNRAELPALRASELAARLEIQPELQLSPSHIHLAFDHFPSTSQTQRFAEKNIGIHSRESAFPIWRAPALPSLAEGHSSQVAPERLPRPAVRGLGAQSPHQISSFHPLKTSRSLSYQGLPAVLCRIAGSRRWRFRVSRFAGV